VTVTLTFSLFLFATACSADVASLRVRLVLDEASCNDPDGDTVEDASKVFLGCGARIGQFVLDPAFTVIHKECATLAPVTGSGTTQSLADVPGLLSQFRSPELGGQETIAVQLFVDTLNSTTTDCEPHDVGAGTLAKGILGQSDVVKLDEAPSGIDVPLSCIQPPPCEDTPAS
jgi:hypothetical protein